MSEEGDREAEKILELGMTTRERVDEAAEDVEQGLVDTDLHGKPGLQKPQAGSETGNESKAHPLPGTKRD